MKPESHRAVDALSAVIDRLKNDRDVVEPFAHRLLERVRERHPHATLDDIGLKITVDLHESGGRSLTEVHQLLRDMLIESVSF